ncbi:MAG: hypothetical protein CMQ42_00010 [Gammaproteobacteria bacterium]|nr:hypothetical protein [Gammaproteobacteria bacterium]
MFITVTIAEGLIEQEVAAATARVASPREASRHAVNQPMSLGSPNALASRPRKTDPGLQLLGGGDGI